MNLKDRFNKETGKLHETSDVFCDCGTRVDIWNDEYVSWLENLVKTLPIASVDSGRELLIAYELKNWVGSKATTKMVENTVDEYISNL